MDWCFPKKERGTRLSKQLFCIFLINCKSGGRDGKRMLSTIQKNEFAYHCIGYDLSVVGRAEDKFLKEVKDVIEKHRGRKIKFVVGGGDGSIRWTLTVIDRIYADSSLSAHIKYPLAILPLGVGNELSRCTGWSKAFALSPFSSASDRLEEYLGYVDNGEDISMDRWNVTMSTGVDGSEPKLTIPSDEPNNTTTADNHDLMLCFLSIGFDSHISNQFQEFRKKNPQYTSNRGVNKMWYTAYGIQAMYQLFPYVESFLELTVDGKVIILPPKIRSLQVFNITTGGDGVDFFAPERPSSAKDILREFTRPSACDGILEVMGTESVMHLMKARLHRSHSRRIAQGRDIKIRVLTRDEVAMEIEDKNNKLDSFPLQIDGEAWTVERGSTIRIKFCDKFKVVRGNKATTGMHASELAEISMEHKEDQSLLEHQL